jgi:hypothetical protein
MSQQSVVFVLRPFLCVRRYPDIDFARENHSGLTLFQIGNAKQRAECAAAIDRGAKQWLRSSRQRRTAFLMGTHAGAGAHSSLQRVTRDRLYEPQMWRMIWQCVEESGSAVDARRRQIQQKVLAEEKSGGSKAKAKAKADHKQSDQRDMSDDEAQSDSDSAAASASAAGSRRRRKKGECRKTVFRF